MLSGEVSEGGAAGGVVQRGENQVCFNRAVYGSLVLLQRCNRTRVLPVSIE